MPASPWISETQRTATKDKLTTEDKITVVLHCVRSIQGLHCYPAATGTHQLLTVAGV